MGLPELPDLPGKRPLKKERKPKPLSSTQLRLLHNIANDLNIMTGVEGMSAHGGFGQTLESMKRRRLIQRVHVVDKEWAKEHTTVRWETVHVLTVSGAEQHRLNCCQRGLSVVDAQIRLLETQIQGGETDDDKSFFGDSFE